MGAVSFSLDERLVKRLVAHLPLAVFVETGTFQGDTLAQMLPYFEELHSVELSEPLWRKAVARFDGNSKVGLKLGSSPDSLAVLKPLLAQKSVLYWLDAHWCVADDTAGTVSQCPLLAEIAAIGALNETSVLLIDDARLFLAPPQSPHEAAHWPRFHAIVLALLKLSPVHELMVVNDVFAFFPPAARTAFEDYAREQGINWHAAVLAMQETENMRRTPEGRISRRFEKAVHKIGAAIRRGVPQANKKGL